MDKAAEWILGNAIMTKFARESLPPTLEEAAQGMCNELKVQGFETTPAGDPITTAAVLEVFDALKKPATG